MCKFVSFVVTKTGKVYGDGTVDNHEEIIRQFKLNDDKPKELLTFARVEITPKDNDIFNHKLDNWVLKIDEEVKPDWWSDKHEKTSFETLKKVFKTQFLIGGEYEMIDKDIRFVKDCKINILKGNLEKLYGKSEVGEMWGSSQVCEMWDNSQVCEMLGSSQVGKMWDNSQVCEMLGSSQVGKMWGSSQVGEMWGSSQVGKMLGSSQVGKMLDSSQVGEMLDSSQVGEMLGSNTVNVWSEKVVIKEQKNGRSVVIKRYLENVEVIIK